MTKQRGMRHETKGVLFVPSFIIVLKIGQGRNEQCIGVFDPIRAYLLLTDMKG